MNIFLVNWVRPGMRDLHRDHLSREFEKDDRFDAVKFRLADPREAGRYRVVGHTTTQWILDDPSYPSTDARIEVGFKRPQNDDRYWYWFNWVEPDRSFMFGWHCDDDHPEHGRVHEQIHQGDSVVDRRSAEIVGENPGAIFHNRLERLPTALDAVEWDGDRAVGFEDDS